MVVDSEKIIHTSHNLQYRLPEVTRCLHRLLLFLLNAAVSHGLMDLGTCR